MTKLQKEVKEILDKALKEADQSHIETVRRHEEIMQMIKEAKA